MEALKVVPEIFFDAIGRVVPGSAFIVLCLTLSDEAASCWQSFFHVVLASGGEPSSAFVAISLAVAAYTVGHVMSPLTKLMQRIGEAYPTKLKKADSFKYEWLRTHKGDVGAHCAKLRAEFTMYNGLAATSLVFSVWMFVTQATLSQRQSIIVVILVVLGVFMLSRGRAGKETFRVSIDNFYEAAGGPPRAK